MRRLCASTVVLLTCALLPCPLAADDAPLQFAGVVLYPDGRPAAGAKVWLTEWEQAGPRIAATSEAAADGTFAFTAPPLSASGYGYYSVLARTEGYAYAWTPRRHTSDCAVRLVLMEPMSLRGKVVDADGKPVAGVRPSVSWLDHVAGFDAERVEDWFCSTEPPSVVGDTLVS